MSPPSPGVSFLERNPASWPWGPRSQRCSWPESWPALPVRGHPCLLAGHWAPSSQMETLLPLQGVLRCVGLGGAHLWAEERGGIAGWLFKTTRGSKIRMVLCPGSLGVGLSREVGERASEPSCPVSCSCWYTARGCFPLAGSWSPVSSERDTQHSLLASNFLESTVLYTFLLI